MLDANLTEQLRGLLANVTMPVELVPSYDDRPKSAELKSLLEEIAALSDKVTVADAEQDKRSPSFLIRRTGTDVAVRFAGLPLGHEFTSLVLALLQVGGHPAKVSDEVAQQIRDLPGEHSFETYMSLTCQNCPTVVQALNLMSVINPKIKHVAIEGSLFQGEIDERNILAVPTIYKDGELFGQGRMDVEEFLAKLDTGTADREAAKLDAQEPYEVLVVGGGPAGATAGIYAARKGIRTAVAGERLGGQVLDTMAIENFISVPYTEGPKLAAGLEEHLSQYELDVLKGQVATKLTGPDASGLTSIEFANGGTLRGKTVVLTTGARWRHMGVPGEEEYRNKGVTFCPHCDGPLFKGKKIAVVGGGNSGIEAAIDLAGVVGQVTVIEFLDVLKADDVLVDKLHSLPNVDVIMSARTTEVLGDGSKVTGLSYEDRTTGETKSLELEGIFVQIGLLPNTEWLKDSGIALSGRGEIEIDARGATSLPGVFAAGDCTTVPFKQIVIAMGAGATASLSAFDHLIRASVSAATTADAGAEQPVPATV